MRFIVGKCLGPGVARWLQQSGHDAVSIYQAHRGMSDVEILQFARVEERIIITNDKDFGERIFRDAEPHQGVILLRLKDERTSRATSALANLLNVHENVLSKRFVVITETTIRFARNP